ncbi:adhesion G-protein coupled receptor V1-like isoform X2 [Halichondria panicea]|uniref:adhesion G-protein coupled receptor V1-like isoform X2 n=1 Tax=Halichondria panicea TaxID=6063 RepID=UPI00312B7A6F
MVEVMVSVRVLLLCLTALQTVWAIPLPMFLPFGPDSGDTELQRGNDVSASVNLAANIPFLGLQRETITVHTDGVLELVSSGGTSASVYAFSADADTTSIGHVFYRETTELAVLNRVNELANLGFGSSTVSSAFIATWFYVGYQDNHDDLTNTFQCIVATDGVRSFTVLMYADNLLQWMTGDSDGGVNGFGGDRADVGFIGEGSNMFFLPGSNTGAVLELDTTTNVGVGGVWIFEVGTSVERPLVDECLQGLSNCDPNANCVDMAIGFECVCLPGYTGDGLSCSELMGSGSGSGSGSGAFPTDLCRGVYDGCCVESSTTDCVISVALVNCSCSQGCFQRGDCCEDILTASCFPEITVGFTASSVRVRENEGPLVLSVSISGDFPDPIQVQPLTSYFVFYTRDGSAEAPDDYDGTVQIIEFSGPGIQNVEVTINDDQLLESSEIFTGHITAGDSFVTVTLQDVSVEIIDSNVATISLEVADYTVGESEGSVMVCTAITQGQLAELAGVQLTTMDGTATALSGSDYTGVNQFLIFSSSDVRQCVNIAIASDNLVESSETFTVELRSTSDDVTLDVSMATVTILDGDRITATISLELADYTVGESEGSVMVCAAITQGQLTGLAGVQLTTMDGTATALSGSDYTGVTEVLIFSSSDVRQCVNIAIASDNLVESSETFTVELSSTNDAITFGVSMGTVTIIDDDTSATISLELADYTVGESEGSVMVCAAITQGQLTGLAGVQLATMDGTATALSGSDYTGVTEFLIFSSSDVRQCVNIAIASDNLVESSETFTVELSSTSDAITFGVSMGTVTIIDDDTSATISLELADYTVGESEGSVMVCAAITQGQLTGLAGVQLTTMDGTATALSGSDYTGVTEVLIFSSSDVRQCVNIAIASDNLVESSETFTVELSSTSDAITFGVSMGTVTIIDDDTSATISLELADYTVGESEGSVMVCAAITQGQLTGLAGVQLTTMDGTATALSGSDYTGVTEVLIFSSSDVRQCVNIAIASDNLVESSETFTVELSSTSDAITFGVSMGTVTIIDDDTSATISLELADYTVGESEGSVMVCAAITQGQLTGLAGVQLTTMDGTATALSGSDYTGVTEVLIFSSSDVRQCVNIAIASDNLVESSETFTVELSSTNDAITFGVSMGTVTIIDDDTSATISLELADYTVGESEGSVMVCAAITQGQLTGLAGVQLTTMDGTATALSGSDYTGVTEVLIFSSSDVRQCVNIAVASDNLVESSETFTVELSSTSDAITFGVSMGTVTIIDDDTSATISLELADYTVGESEGSVMVCAAITQGQLTGLAGVQLATMDGTATALSGSDYTGVTEVLIFSSSDVRQCVNIAIASDNLVESSETFTVELSSTSDAITFGVSMGTVTIIDDDTSATISLELADYTVGESEGSVMVCAAITQGQLTGLAGVQLTTMDGTATALSGSDYTGVTEVLIFSSSDVRQCVNIAIASDNLVESSETFTVELSSTSDAITFGVSMGTVTIIDDDTSATISLELADYTVGESEGSVMVCAAITQGQLTGLAGVQLTTMDGTATALSGSDYTGVTEVLIFSSSDVRQCVNIAIASDNLVESSETFTVELSSTSDAITFGVSMGTVTIIDDDTSATISLELADYTIGESEGSVMVCAAITQGQLTGLAGVQLTTMDGTATALSGSDYTGVTEVLIFSSSDVRQCVNIAIASDNLVESSETFTVELSSTSDAITFGVSMGTVTIVDDDTVTVSLEMDVYSVAEDSGSLVVCAVITSEQLLSAETVSVQLSATDGTAEAGSDYFLGTMSLTFTANGLTQCGGISITQDSRVENDETFTLQLTSSDPDVTLGASMATVTILNDDTVTVSLEMGVYSVTEDSGSLMVCAAITDGEIDPGVLLPLQFSSVVGTATPGSDYTPVNSAQFLSSINTRQCVNIAIAPDNLVESSETFVVELSSASDAITLGVSMGTVTIIDDDTSATISLEAADYTVGESEGSVMVCAAITQGQLTGLAGVQLTTMDGTATALSGSDYTGVTEFLIFSSSDVRQCVNIAIASDNLVESSETFTVELSSTSDAITLGVSMGTVTILDDDTSATISLEEANYIISESEGSVMVCAAITQGQLTGLAGVQLTTMDGTATALFGSDYTGVNEFLIFSSSDVRQCVNIAIAPDNLVESSETFTVELSSTSNAITFGVSMGTVIINNSDNAQVSFSQAADSVSEGTSFVSVCVSVSGPALAISLPITIATQETGSAIAGSDFVADSFPLVFDSSSPTEMCVNVALLDDTTSESTESFSVVLVSPPPQGALFVAPQTTVVTITDNDGTPADCSFQFIQSSYSGPESAGFFSVCVQLDGITTTATSLVFSTRDGTAMAGSDYVASSVSVNFGPSLFGIDVQCPRVEFIDDNLAEPDESFLVDLSDPQGGCSIITPTSTVTIFASDGAVDPLISFEGPLQLSLTEGGPSAEVCLSIDTLPPPGQTVTATYDTVANTATAGDDYVDKIGEISFTSTSPTRICLPLDIIDDSFFESNELFTIRLQQTGQPDQTVLVTIISDDPLPATIAVEMSTYSVNEEDGSLSVCIVVNGAQLTAPTTITVTANDITANAGFDYAPLTTLLMFTPSGPRRQCTTVTILEDTVQEGTETFSISLTSGDFPGSLGSPAIVSILDTLDNTVSVGLSQLSYTFNENEDATNLMVCVDLTNNVVNRDVILTLTLRAGSALAGQDFVAETVTVTFSPINTEPFICEFITLINDVINEPTEMFFADLSTTDSAVVFFRQSASITIIDDDPPIVATVVGFSDPSFSVLEGESQAVVPVCLTISEAPLSGQLDFTVSTIQGSALDGSDYIGGDRIVSFVSGGATTQCAMYTIVGNDLPESSTESFLVSVSAGGLPVTLSPNTATVVIIDDDEVSPGIVIINDTPRVTLDSPTSASVLVDFTLRSDVASALCQLGTLGPVDCSSRTVTFFGLPPDRQEPYTFIVTAFDSQGLEIANITRQVRLGFNMDCSVVFVNAAQEDVVVVDEAGFVQIEWNEIGPVTDTECRLTINGAVGEYVPCTSPSNLGNLVAGVYAFKVRPNGDACARRIRRTVNFTIE